MSDPSRGQVTLGAAATRGHARCRPSAGGSASGAFFLLLMREGRAVDQKRHYRSYREHKLAPRKRAG
jgi:hypothetical protein